MTLTDGKTIGIPYPQPGYNCTAEWALSQKKTQAPDPEGFKGLEHCPDFDERFTLANGTTKAIPYPQTGYNCSAEWALSKNSNQITKDSQQMVQDSEKLTI